MFLAIFWSAFIPIGALILSLIGEWLIQSFQQLRPYAWSDLLEPRPQERGKTRPQASRARVLVACEFQLLAAAWCAR
jgi:hypothetical protein